MSREPGVYDASGAKLVYESGALRRADGADIKWPLNFVEEPWTGPIPQGITIGVNDERTSKTA